MTIFQCVETFSTQLISSFHEISLSLSCFCSLSWRRILLISEKILAFHKPDVSLPFIPLLLPFSEKVQSLPCWLLVLWRRSSENDLNNVRAFSRTNLYIQTLITLLLKCDISVNALQGISLSVGSNKALADSLEAAVVPGHPYFNTLLRILATRCMMQALYFCSGSLPKDEYYHYGLAAEIYTHFTSPIRRSVEFF